jgi:hypothetical protein
MRNYKVIQVEVGPSAGTLYAVAEDGSLWYTANALANPVVWVEITPPPAQPEQFPP